MNENPGPIMFGLLFLSVMKRLLSGLRSSDLVKNLFKICRKIRLFFFHEKLRFMTMIKGNVLMF